MRRRHPGGRTITQQLIKNVTSEGSRSLWNKLKEAVLAIKLEQIEDKDHILERYLNVVYFGRGVYGVQAAAQVYFGVPAAELTLPQAALLAGLLRSPETADPAEDPEEATRRRQTVLDAMVEAGAVSDEEAAAAAAEPVEALPEVDAVRLVAGVAPHFVDWVTRRPIAAVGEAAIYRDGLRIVTTLDLDAQRAAEQSVAKVLSEPGDPQAALIALDTDGAVRAHVGSRSYEELQVDVVRGRRRRRFRPSARLHVQAVRAPGRPRARRTPRATPTPGPPTSTSRWTALHGRWTTTATRTTARSTSCRRPRAR